MLPGYLDYMMGREHYRELLLEAEQGRLIRLALSQHDAQDHLYGRALNWLGCQMVSWGRRLQDRYRAVSTARGASNCTSLPVI